MWEQSAASTQPAWDSYEATGNGTISSVDQLYAHDGFQQQGQSNGWNEGDYKWQMPTAGTDEEQKMMQQQIFQQHFQHQHQQILQQETLKHLQQQMGQHMMQTFQQHMLLQAQAQAQSQMQGHGQQSQPEPTQKPEEELHDSTIDATDEKHKKSGGQVLKLSLALSMDSEASGTPPAPGLEQSLPDGVPLPPVVTATGNEAVVPQFEVSQLEAWQEYPWTEPWVEQQWTEHRQWPDMLAETTQYMRRKGGMAGSQDDAPPKGMRAGSQLRQLLDFYFEPFNLQNNKYLLDLISRKLGSPASVGPWLSDRLLDLTFRLEDLLGLNRIAAALDKLRSVGCEVIPGPLAGGSPGGSDEIVVRRRPNSGRPQQKPASAGHLKHLLWTEKGELVMRCPPEVRTFVAARGALLGDFAAPSMQISALWEKLTKQAGRSVISIASMHCNAEQESNLSEHQAQQLQGQLKRQLLLFRVDVICLQGLNPLSGAVGNGIVTALREDGYDYVWSAGEHDEVAIIFYDTKRLKLVRSMEFYGAVAAEVQLTEEHCPNIRVANMKAKVPTTSSEGLGRLLGDEGRPLLVSADCEDLGGAEARSVVEEFAQLNSLAHTVLGEELQVPVCRRDPVSATHRPVVLGASRLNKLGSPDALLFSRLTPLLALSGYTSQHLAMLSPEDVSHQFPGWRLPLLGCFDVREVSADSKVA